MPVQNKPIIHGRDHETDGADPIRGLLPAVGGDHRSEILATAPGRPTGKLNETTGDWADTPTTGHRPTTPASTVRGVDRDYDEADGPPDERHQSTVGTDRPPTAPARVSPTTLASRRHRPTSPSPPGSTRQHRRSRARQLGDLRQRHAAPPTASTAGDARTSTPTASAFAVTGDRRRRRRRRRLPTTRSAATRSTADAWVHARRYLRRHHRRSCTSTAPSSAPAPTPVSRPQPDVGVLIGVGGTTTAPAAPRPPRRPARPTSPSSNRALTGDELARPVDAGDEGRRRRGRRHRPGHRRTRSGRHPAPRSNTATATPKKTRSRTGPAPTPAPPKTAAAGTTKPTSNTSSSTTAQPGRFDVPPRKWTRVPFNTVRIQRRWELDSRRQLPRRLARPTTAASPNTPKTGCC